MQVHLRGRERGPYVDLDVDLDLDLDLDLDPVVVLNAVVVAVVPIDGLALGVQPRR